MLMDVLFSRFKQGKQTMDYPNGPAPALPERFVGMPVIDQNKCRDCSAPCLEECPVGALTKEDGQLQLDMGKCLFCRECEVPCSRGGIRFSSQYQLAAAGRDSLIVNDETAAVRTALNRTAEKLCGRSFNLRVVSAGGCGACEADTNVLNTLAWDLSRFGIHYVASPRHADGLLITGPLTKNMASAVKDTYEAIPEPKFVIAVGTCAVSGGLYAASDECVENREALIPVDLHIPGCPPHPLTILDGMLRFLGKIP
jgi:Ni,Fe-hydrogenase III small subunit/formate hydrogenlyase subunit 6/NADH:ubiquinone oxidoreductase subunit I